MIPRLLITGATSFVGTTVCEQAIRRGLAVKGVLRAAHMWRIGCMESFVVGEINDVADWGSALRDVNVIIYLAELT